MIRHDKCDAQVKIRSLLKLERKDVMTEQLREISSALGHPQRRYAEFGARLRDLLIQRGLTPADVAEHLGVSGQMILKYQRGNAMPPLARLQRLAEFLAVPVETLDDVNSRYVSQRRPPPPTQRPPLSAAPARPRQEAQAPSLKEQLADELFTWARLHLPMIRRDLEVPDYPRVHGPYFRYQPDFLVVGDHGPLLAVDIKVGENWWSWAELVGEAVNWREATHGAPLLVVWIASDLSLERTAAGEARFHHLRDTSDLIKDAFVMRDMRDGQFRPDLDRLKSRIEQILRI
jgi:transcriptional regulator with XRE-family HTH domain